MWWHYYLIHGLNTTMHLRAIDINQQRNAQRTAVSNSSSLGSIQKHICCNCGTFNLKTQICLQIQNAMKSNLWIFIKQYMLWAIFFSSVLQGSFVFIGFLSFLFKPLLQQNKIKKIDRATFNYKSFLFHTKLPTFPSFSNIILNRYNLSACV